MPRPTKINPHIKRQIARIQKDVDALEAERAKPVVMDDALGIQLYGPTEESVSPEGDAYLQELKDDIAAYEASITEIEELSKSVEELKAVPAVVPVDLDPIEERTRRTEEQVRCMSLLRVKEINLFGILVPFEAYTDEGQRWALPFANTRYILVLNANGTGFAFVRDSNGKANERSFTWEIDTIRREITCSVPETILGSVWKDRDE